MTTAVSTRRASRLLAPDALHGPATLEAHLGRYGPLRLEGSPGAQSSDRLWGEIERSGLTGRGGAGFPMARKLASASATARPALIVNAMEGEPASAKDRLLVGTAPHLVLDGAEVVAGVLGAHRTVVCVADSARLRWRGAWPGLDRSGPAATEAAPWRSASCQVGTSRGKSPPSHRRSPEARASRGSGPTSRSR